MSVRRRVDFRDHLAESLNSLRFPEPVWESGPFRNSGFYTNRLRADAFFREKLGAGFVDYLLTIKDAEIARFQAEVTDWEHREYFEAF